MIHASIGPMMYDPNVFTLNLEQLLSGIPLDAAIGVIQITLHAARGLKSSKIGGGSPDPFVGVSINNRQELARTKYRHSTSVLFPRLFDYLTNGRTATTRLGWKPSLFLSILCKSS